MYSANAARYKPSKGKTKRIGRVWNTEEFQKNFFGKKMPPPRVICTTIETIPTFQTRPQTRRTTAFMCSGLLLILKPSYIYKYKPIKIQDVFNKFIRLLI